MGKGSPGNPRGQLAADTWWHF